MNVNNTKYELMETMEGLMKDHEYSEITVGMITAELGITRQGFYKYYRNKDDLCAKMFAHFGLSGLMMDEDFTIRELGMHYLSSVKEHNIFYSRVVESVSGEALLLSGFAVATKYFSELAAYLLERPVNWEEEHIIKMYFFGVVGLVMDMMMQCKDMVEEEGFDLLWRAMPEELKVLFGNRTINCRVQDSMREQWFGLISEAVLYQLSLPKSAGSK